MARKKRQPHRFRPSKAHLSARSSLKRQSKAPYSGSAKHPSASVQSTLPRQLKAPYSGRTAAGIVDIIDRVLDKGIVVEYHARVAIVGIDTLVRIDARYIAASFSTYVRIAEPVRRAGLIASIGFDR